MPRHNEPYQFKKSGNIWLRREDPSKPWEALVVTKDKDYRPGDRSRHSDPERRGSPDRTQYRPKDEWNWIK